MNESREVLVMRMTVIVALSVRVKGLCRVRLKLGFIAILVSSKEGADQENIFFAFVDVAGCDGAYMILFPRIRPNNKPQKARVMVRSKLVLVV